MRQWSLLSLSIFVLLTGCDGFYQTIPKNTVMIKKITELVDIQTDYPGILSEETVKSLCVDAINKHMGHNLSLEDVTFTVIFLNQKQVKEMIYQNMNQFTPNMDPLVQYKAELSQIPRGLYFANVINQYDKMDQYTIALNAGDGEMLGVYNKVNVIVGNESMLSQENKAKILQVAEFYIKQYGDVNLETVELDPNQIYWQPTTRLSYQDKKTKNLKYNVLIEAYTQKVVGFTKNIISELIILSDIAIEDSLSDG